MRFRSQTPRDSPLPSPPPFRCPLPPLPPPELDHLRIPLRQERLIDLREISSSFGGSLHELVKEGENGLTFTTAEELAGQLHVRFSSFPLLLSAMMYPLRAFQGRVSLLSRPWLRRLTGFSFV